MKQTFNIVKKVNGEPVIQEVTGEFIVIPGFEDYKFFIHKKINGDPGWTVSEYGTGHAVYKHRDKGTKAHAIEMALYTLNRYGKKQLDECISYYKKINIDNSLL